ncbi:MAG TPA: hypothetical protein VJR58_23620 [Vineibacter sp.]|nr:hypothetical protein [Vineibacter sp.]
MSNLPLLSHLVAGCLTFAFFWAAVLTVKGSPSHRFRGKLFFVSLFPVGISVGAILVLRSDTFDPARMIQFIYLLLCLLTVGTVGWTAIRWKQQVERFRGVHFRILGPAMFVSGAVVLIAGALAGQPLAMILSSIGLVYGAAMIRFARTPLPLHPKWWLGWHLNSVLLLSSAVHGTLLAVIYRTFVDPSGFDAAQLVTQPGTLLLALGLRAYIGRQRGVPMRFAATPRMQPVQA